jgi:putative hemolysin
MTFGILLAIFLLLLVSAFFTGGETAVTSASRAHFQHAASRGDKRAQSVLDFLRNMQTVLGTTLVGTNLATVSSTTLASVLLGTALAGNPGLMKWESILNTLIMAPLLLIIGELVPKAIGRSHANAVTAWTCAPLRFFRTLFYPLAMVSGALGVLVAKLFGGTGADNRSRVTREDLLAATELATEDGIVEEDEGTMIQTVFELENRTVSSVMVPLVDVVALSVDGTFEDMRLAAEHGHTRFPVYEGRIDEIVGIIDMRQVLYAIPPTDMQEEALANLRVKDFMSGDVHFVPESKAVGQLLQELRFQAFPMAVVVDEHGGVVGVVTTEDLVEEVVGEIQDERDKELRSILQVAEKVYDCDGKLEVRQLSDELGIEFNDPDFETVGGLIMKLAGRIPTPGQRFTCQGYEIEVLDVVRRRVGRVRFRRLG